jgi:uncharacterized protein
MPSALTYPGVYIEEIPSGVRTVAGVATSVTAFIGGARKGPTDRAVSINNFGDYERHFGPLHTDSYLGYAVNHFFANGGTEGRVVRVVHPDAAPAAGSGGGLTVQASSAGSWGNVIKLTVRPTPDGRRFALRIADVTDPNKEVVLETYNGLSLATDDACYAGAVLNDPQVSLVVRLSNHDEAPSPGEVTLSGGDDGPVPVLLPDSDEFKNAVNPQTNPRALDALDRLEIFNLLCVPGFTDEGVLAELQKFCEDHRAFLIVDCRQDATVQGLEPGPNSTLVSGPSRKNSAFYFPWVRAGDPLRDNRLRDFPPCGFVAGVYARTDAERGVWKAPAGTEAGLTGSSGLTVVMTDLENGRLNPDGVNCLRQFPVYGRVVWGARTLDGADERASDHKYVPVRRLTLFIEESLYRGTQWAVFEPNDEPLWAQLRLNVGAFMNDLFRKGAFQGRSPREAYFVKCDKETTTQNDVNRGIVNVVVGFAPLKPAEFVVLKIQQMAGQIQT